MYWPWAGVLLYGAQPNAYADSFQVSWQEEVPELYQQSVAVAAARFDELQHVRIRFRYQPIRTTLNVRPAFFSVFRRPHRRIYVIRINEKIDFQGITIDEVPLEAQIGIWGHELSHVLDYHQKSSFGILHTGLRYIFRSSRSAYEKEIDEMTIHRGLGNELRAWKIYLYRHSSADDSYLNYKRSVYYSPAQIDSLLQIYQDRQEY